VSLGLRKRERLERLLVPRDERPSPASRRPGRFGSLAKRGGWLGIGMALTACQQADVPSNQPRSPHRQIETPIARGGPDVASTMNAPLLEFPAGQPWSPDGRRVLLGQRIYDLTARSIAPAPCGRCCDSPTWALPDAMVFDCHGGSLVWDVERNVVEKAPTGGELVVLGRGHVIASSHSASAYSASEHSTSEHSASDGRMSRDLRSIPHAAAIGGPMPSPPGTWWGYSPDGESALSIAPDGEVALIDVSSGERTVVADGGLLERAGPFQPFSPDSSLCVVPRRGEPALVLDVHAGRSIGELERGRMGSRQAQRASFAGGTPFVRAGNDAGGCDAVSSAAWSADGALVALGTTHGDVCLFESAGRTLVRSWPATHSAPQKNGAPIGGAVASLAFVGAGRGLLAGPVAELAGPSCGYGSLFRTDSGAKIADLGVVCRPRAAANGALVYEELGFPTRMIAGDLTVVPDDVSHFGAAGELSPDGQWVAFAGSLGGDTGGGAKATLVGTIDHRIVVLDDLPGGDRLSGRVAFDPTSTRLLGEGTHAIGAWEIATGRLLLSASTR
jgi:hypothetical protein